MKLKKIIYHTLDLIFLSLSYLLCDFINKKSNLILGLIIGFISYIIINYLLRKILKIDDEYTIKNKK